MPNCAPFHPCHAASWKATRCPPPPPLPPAPSRPPETRYTAAASAARADALFSSFARLAGCGGAANTSARLRCLRTAPLPLLWNASFRATAPPPGGLSIDALTFGAVVDGVELPATPFALVARGAVRRGVPLLCGVNTNEGNGLVYSLVQRPMGPAQFEDFARRFLAKLELERLACAPAPCRRRRPLPVFVPRPPTPPRRQAYPAIPHRTAAAAPRAPRAARARQQHARGARGVPAPSRAG